MRESEGTKNWQEIHVQRRIKKYNFGERHTILRHNSLRAKQSSYAKWTTSRIKYTSENKPVGGSWYVNVYRINVTQPGVNSLFNERVIIGVTDKTSKITYASSWNAKSVLYKFQHINHVEHKHKLYSWEICWAINTQLRLAEAFDVFNFPCMSNTLENLCQVFPRMISSASGH